MILNVILDKYKGKGLYVAFVDFTAAFDSIDRPRLIAKLQSREALDGTFLNFLSAMLKGVNAAVKGAVLKWFNEGLGVKQGDQAGPRVFVTYIHDLPESVCLDDQHSRQHAVFLINQIIKCLLWADDLVLVSTDPLHLQAQLDALDAYCMENKLNVNTKKTQVMYVHTRSSHRPSSMHVFTYRGIQLDYVDEYKYLGVLIDRKGSFDTQAVALIKKATACMYMCMSKCRHIAFRCPPKLRVTLFRAYVISHFIYACEVVPYTRKHVDSMNKLILKFARWATGLPAHACSNAVLREAGLRPIEYDMLQARMNYLLLIKSRPTSHATNLVW